MKYPLHKISTPLRALNSRGYFRGSNAISGFWGVYFRGSEVHFTFWRVHFGHVGFSEDWMAEYCGASGLCRRGCWWHNYWKDLIVKRKPYFISSSFAALAPLTIDTGPSPLFQIPLTPTFDFIQTFSSVARTKNQKMHTIAHHQSRQNLYWFYARRQEKLVFIGSKKGPWSKLVGC